MMCISRFSFFLFQTWNCFTLVYLKKKKMYYYKEETQSA